MIETLYKAFLENPLICTDTRKITPGCLFFALKGDNFNGNKFAAEAIEKGAILSVIDEQEFEGENTFLVNNVLETLQQLAYHHRKQLNIPVIALTGSNGKTTSKELIFAVLNSTYDCTATEGNLNNHIGVPLTLLKVNKAHQLAIVEMGANHLHEIEQLCEIAKPDYGIITNIGKAHIGEFGGYENIIRAKTEMYRGVSEATGRLFVNADDPLLMEKAAKHKQVTYGKSEMADFQGQLISSDPFLKVDWMGQDINTQLVGNYNFDNVMLAIAIGRYFDVAPEDIKGALEAYTPSNNRSQILKTDRNTIIMDAYNANPSSVWLALENMRNMSSPNKYFILGDMLELGEDEAKEHKKICNYIQSHQINGIFVGNAYKDVHQDNEYSRVFANTEEAQAYIQSNPIQDQLILLKGSRGIRLEKLQPVL